MNEASSHFGFLRELTWSRLALVLITLAACSLLVLGARRIVRAAAESAPSHRRLLILRMAPLSRLAIWVVGIAIIVTVLVENTYEDFVAVVATVGLALAFAL